MASQPVTRYTPEQYLALERAAPFKTEYIAGEMVAMAGASREHDLITLNISASLHAQLLTRECEVHTSDMRVKVGAAFFYPDVSVVCGEIELFDARRDIFINPTAIVEVLSPSTERYDLGAKFVRYRDIRSLQEVVFVAQDERRIEHYSRHGDNQWLLSTHSEPASVIELTSIGCRLNVEDIYRKLEFEQSV